MPFTRPMTTLATMKVLLLFIVLAVAVITAVVFRYGVVDVQAPDGVRSGTIDRWTGCVEIVTARGIPASTSIEVDQSTNPVPTSTPVLTEEEEALSWLALFPECVPSTVKLVEAREFPVVIKNVVRGRTTIPAGVTSKVKAWDQETVTAEFAGSPQRVTQASTDFLEQVIATYRTNRKLDSIILPHFAVSDATVREAIAFLQQQSEEQDRSVDGMKGGIEFKLSLDSNAAASTLTIDLANVPLREAIDSICNLADLRFQPYQNAVIVGPKVPGT